MEQTRIAKWSALLAAILIIGLLLFVISNNANRNFTLKQIKVYTLDHKELSGPGNPGAIRGSLTTDTNGIQNGTKLTFSYWGSQYTGEVCDEFILWDNFPYSSLIPDSPDGYTTVTYGKKSFDITFTCKYPFDDGDYTYIHVVMDFERQ